MKIHCRKSLWTSACMWCVHDVKYIWYIVCLSEGGWAKADMMDHWRRSGPFAAVLMLSRMMLIERLTSRKLGNGTTWTSKEEKAQLAYCSFRDYSNACIRQRSSEIIRYLNLRNRWKNLVGGPVGACPPPPFPDALGGAPIHLGQRRVPWQWKSMKKCSTCKSYHTNLCDLQVTDYRDLRPNELNESQFWEQFWQV